MECCCRMKRVIEKTDDGSATLFVPELNEHYHSTKGARTESQHIFIDMGFKASSATIPRILEIGFGTGLNAWLTLEEAERSRRNILYTGLELYPLEWQTIEQLGYISNDEQLTTTVRQQPAIELFKQLHTSPWEKDVQLTPHFTLRKVETDVNKWVENRERTMSNINDSVTNAESPALNLSFNLIYFDAFAPEKQPEMPAQPERPVLPPLPLPVQNTVRSLHARWAAEEAAMRRSQPGFDLKAELKNPEMRRLMQLPGMRVQDAYRLAHYEDALRTTAQTVEMGVVERVQQGAAGPLENGLRPGAAASVRPDVAAMTRAQREALERRVLHGAQIEL